MNTPRPDEHPQILVVEDSLTQAEELKYTLEQHGFASRHARNGVEALRSLRERKPLLVISDINMPEMNGYALCRRIRADANMADLPIILLTSLSDTNDVLLGLEAGADNFVTKPHDENYLMSRIHYIMANRHVRSVETGPSSIEICHGGRKHRITADRLQILHLLLSTFESAVLRNKQLTKAQDELRRLNETLEEKVQQRTAALTAEIAERNRADAERARLLRERESLLESTSEGIFGLDAEGRCTFINRTAAELLGEDAGQLVAANIHSVVQLLRPDKNRYSMEESPVYKAYTYGERYRTDSEYFSPRNGESFPVEYAACPIREAGVIRGAVVTFRDITEKKKLEIELLRAQRVESVGRLANGIAHDMNNILAPIMMSTPLLRMGMAPDEAEIILSTIEASAERGAALVRQLLMFGRGIEGERHPVSPAAMITEVLKICTQTFPRSIAISTNISEGVWPVHGDETQILQVLLNLCVNARDAMPDGGSLAISAENLEIDAQFAAAGTDAKQGKYILVRVADTGSGIPREIADRIFDPFFTTKEVGKGTGLGLSTALAIIKSHGGFVRLKTEIRRGTTFEVYLPASPGYESMPPFQKTSVECGNGELILVVDDEQNIRTVLRETLIQNNYKVVTAQDGVEAIGVFAANREAKMIITDLDMPLMDGIHLARVLRRMDPAVKILMSTGLAAGSRADKRQVDIDALKVNAVLTKPYTSDKLLKAVHAALTEGTAN